MRTKRIAKICILLAVSLLVSNVVFAKDKDYVQGVTDNEILIGSFFPMTGPAALWGLSYTDGADMYFKEVNAKGGVHGRMLTQIIEDTTCQPVKGVAAVKKLLSKKPFMLNGPACSGVAFAALQSIVDEGIPWFSPGVSTQKIFIPPRKNVFRMGSFPDNVQAKAVVDFDIDELKARKIAIIADASEYGQNGAEGIISRLKEYGLEPVAVEKMNTGDTDFVTQILKVKAKNPEVLHLYCYPKEAAILVRQAKELGFKGQILGCASLSTPGFLKAVGDSVIGTLAVYTADYLIDSQDPKIVNFVKKLKANYRITPGRPSYCDLIAYGGAQVLVEGLRRAGRDLTWQKYIDALNTIKDFKPEFLPPVSFSPDDHNGTKTGKFLVFLPNGKRQILKTDAGVKENVETLKE